METTTVASRLSDEQMKKLEGLAKRHTQGNVSAMIKVLLFAAEYMEKTEAGRKLFDLAKRPASKYE